MPIDDEPCLVDTSVAVPLLTAGHEHHDSVFDEVGALRLGLAGHSAFETFSVLSRLPPPHRRSPEILSRLLTSNFPESRYLSADGAQALLAQLGRSQIAGGAVYDALVAATAVEHRMPLVTRDRRAIATYREVGAEIRVIT